MKNRRGFMLIDAIVAMGLIGVIATTLLLAKSGMKRLDDAMADRRTATRSAERYLLESQVASVAAPPGASLRVTDLELAAPKGWKWVSVDSIANGRHGEIVGMIRSGS